MREWERSVSINHKEWALYYFSSPRISKIFYRNAIGVLDDLYNVLQRRRWSQVRRCNCLRFLELDMLPYPSIYGRCLYFEGIVHSDYR